MAWRAITVHDTYLVTLKVDMRVILLIGLLSDIVSSRVAFINLIIFTFFDYRLGVS